MRLLTIFILVFVLSSWVVTIVAADTNEQPASDFARNVLVDLQTEHKTYHVSDDVRIKVSITNSSPVALGLVFLAPWYDVELTVTDASSRTIRPNLKPHNPVISGSLRPDTIQPRERISETKYLAPMPDASSVIDSNGFVSLKTWGYILDQPGAYTIVARRRLQNTFSPPSPAITIVVDNK